MFFSVRPPKARKRESRREADDQGEEYFHLGCPMFNTPSYASAPEETVPVVPVRRKLGSAGSPG